MADSHPHQGYWLWVGGAMIAVAASAVGAAASQNSNVPHPHNLWTTPGLMAAYMLGAGALVCFTGAVKQWEFPLAHQRAMDPAHAAPLRKTADRLHAAIRGGVALQYFDGGPAEQHHRDYFMRHYPEFSDSFAEWDGIAGALPITQADTEAAIYASGRERWPNWGAPIEHCTSYVRNNLRNTAVPLPEPQFVCWEWEGRVQVIQGVNGNGRLLMDVEEATDVDRQNARDLTTSLRDWVFEMHGSEPASRWRHLLDRRDELAADLGPRLVDIAHADALPRKGRCDKRCLS